MQQKKQFNFSFVCRITFLLLSFSTITSAGETTINLIPYKAILLGWTNSDSVELMWHLEEWSPQISGFTIKKRSVTKDQQAAWITIHEKPIAIGCSKEKDLSYITNDTQAIKKYEQLKNKLITSNQIMSREQIEHAFEKSESTKSMLGALRRYLKKDLDIAKLAGFSLLDNFPVQADQQYEYGLFILKNNQVSNKPSATYRTQIVPDKDLYKITQFKAEGRKFGVRVSWHFSKDQHKALAGRGFNLYRKPSKSTDNYAFIKKIGGVEMPDGSWKYFDYDKNADVNKSYEYIVKPVSLFAGELDVPSYGQYISAKVDSK